jgi:cysteine desulfurase family protein
MIYFDNAATTWPKPERVSKAMIEAIEIYGANPGRGGHKLSIQAGRIILQTRVRLSKLFNVKDPSNIIFFQNATGALNQAIKGFQWKENDKIVSTSYEHNSVRRPIEYLRQSIGVEGIWLNVNRNGEIDEQILEKELSKKPKLIVTTHVSNLTGCVLPIAKIGKLAKRYGVPFLVDASQSAGAIPIDVVDMNIDLLALPGHKGLYGPQGIGVLYISPSLNLIPLLHGGTGSQSEEIDQPSVRPDRYEAGTVNTPGIAGLKAGLEFIEEVGLQGIWQHEQMLTKEALNRLSQIKGLNIYGPEPAYERAPVISFNLDGLDAHELAYILDQHYNIATRAGMHCTPLGHQSISTLETGAVRVSFGYFNTLEEVKQLEQAIQEISIAMS